MVGAPPKSAPVITWRDFQFRVVSARCVGSQHAHPRHRLLPDVWDDVMFIPATGFHLMCGVTQFSPPPQALPDVWDDTMLNPATGCSKMVSAYQGKSPRIKEVGFRLDQQSTPRNYLSQCLVPRVANWACRLYSAESGGNGIARRASASGISQGTPTCKPTRVGGMSRHPTQGLEGEGRAHAPGQT